MPPKKARDEMRKKQEIAAKVGRWIVLINLAQENHDDEYGIMIIDNGDWKGGFDF